MQAWKLIAVATISGWIGGAGSLALFGNRVIAANNPPQILTLDTLNVNHIVLKGELQIAASSPGQATPDLLINRLGIYNVVMTMQDGKATGSSVVQLSPVGGLKFSLFSAPNALPTQEVQVTPLQIAIQNGTPGLNGGADLIALGGHGMSVSSGYGIAGQETRVNIDEHGMHCFKPGNNGNVPCTQ